MNTEWPLDHSSVKTEHELLEVLQVAERRADRPAIENAVNELALFYCATDQFSAGAKFWRRGAELLAESTAPDSRELGTYLFNMALMCLIPAGLREEAQTILKRARALHEFHFGQDDPRIKNIDELLRGSDAG